MTVLQHSWYVQIFYCDIFWPCNYYLMYSFIDVIVVLVTQFHIRPLYFQSLFVQVWMFTLFTSSSLLSLFGFAYFAWKFTLLTLQPSSCFLYLFCFIDVRIVTPVRYYSETLYPQIYPDTCRFCAWYWYCCISLKNKWRKYLPARFLIVTLIALAFPGT